MTTGDQVREQIAIFGVPFDGGAGRRGAAGGPAALRDVGLVGAFLRSGQAVEDFGDLRLPPVAPIRSPRPILKNFAEAAALTGQLITAAKSALEAGALPVWLGGDHTISAGTVAGAAAYAKSVGRRQFVLWLDAHPDFNTLQTTVSGHLHGVPVAFFCGLPGFDGFTSRPLAATVAASDVAMLGIRSVDPLEQALLDEHRVEIHTIADMRSRGVEALLRPFLARVADADGLLHVSFDVDFLDPALAPAVGTPVATGATLSEARLAVDLIRESGLMTSLDIVELAPSLAEGDQTARHVVELSSHLFAPRRLRRSLEAGSAAMHL